MTVAAPAPAATAVHGSAFEGLPGGYRPTAAPSAADSVSMSHSSTYLHAKLAAVNQMAVSAVTSSAQAHEQAAAVEAAREAEAAQHMARRQLQCREQRGEPSGGGADPFGARAGQPNGVAVEVDPSGSRPGEPYGVKVALGQLRLGGMPAHQAQQTQEQQQGGTGTLWTNSQQQQQQQRQQSYQEERAYYGLSSGHAPVPFPVGWCRLTL
jgi:hypothetical protein